MDTRKLRKSTIPGRLPAYLFTLLIILVLTACEGTSDATQKPPKVTRTISPTKKSITSEATNPTHTPTSSPPPVSTLGVDPIDLDGKTIEFWHGWSGASGDKINDIVEDFNDSNEWGIDVEATYQGNYDQIFEHLDAAHLDEALPDLIIGYNYQALNWAPSPDVLVDLQEYVNDPLWGYTDEEQSDFYPVFWEGNILDKRRIGVPAHSSGQMLYYNRTWAKELGYSSPPTTPIQFKRQACAAAKANRGDDDPSNDSSGGWIISTDYSAMVAWFHAFNAEIVKPDGTGYQFNTPEVEDALNFLRDLYDDGCAWLTESQFPESDFANRQGLFATGSVADIPYQEAAFADVESTDEWTVIPFPSPENEPVIDVYGPSFQVLKSGPENQLASWLFIKWLTSPENQAILAQASGYYPVRASSLEHLNLLPNTYPQWVEAVDLLSKARSEPPFQSWRVVRWAISDAATQLYRYYFAIDQVPSLVKLLDVTANDLHTGEP